MLQSFCLCCLHFDLSFQVARVSLSHNSMLRTSCVFLSSMDGWAASILNANCHLLTVKPQEADLAVCLSFFSCKMRLVSTINHLSIHHLLISCLSIYSPMYICLSFSLILLRITMHCEDKWDCPVCDQERSGRLAGMGRHCAQPLLAPRDQGPSRSPYSPPTIVT